MIVYWVRAATDATDVGAIIIKWQWDPKLELIYRRICVQDIKGTLSGCWQEYSIIMGNMKCYRIELIFRHVVFAGAFIIKWQWDPKLELIYRRFVYRILKVRFRDVGRSTVLTARYMELILGYVVFLWVYYQGQQCPKLEPRFVYRIIKGTFSGCWQKYSINSQVHETDIWVCCFRVGTIRDSNVLNWNKYRVLCTQGT